MDFKSEVQGFLGVTGMSQAELARSVGTSPATLSQIMKGNYLGDSERILDRIGKYIENYKRREEGSAGVWLETANTRLAGFIVEKTASHRKMALVYGMAGTGKTETCRRLCENFGNGVFIETDAAITPRSFLYRITSVLKIQGKRALSDTLDIIGQALRLRDIVLFIDEAEYLDYRSLELARRINDFTGTPIVLSGTFDLLRKLKKHRQLASRIRWSVEMKPLTKAENDQYCLECGCDKEAAKIVFNRARGNFRDIENLVADAGEISGNRGVSAGDVTAALETAFIF